MIIYSNFDIWQDKKMKYNSTSLESNFSLMLTCISRVSQTKLKPSLRLKCMFQLLTESNLHWHILKHVSAIILSQDEFKAY